MDERFCLYCNARIRGRSDKKFCNDSCRNSYNNRQNSIPNGIIRNVNIILRRNRQLLARLLGEGRRAKISREKLLKRGFIFEYFTGQFVDKDGRVYFYVYDYGYCALSANRYLVVKGKDEEYTSYY